MKREDAGHAEISQREGDDERIQDRRKPAEGIDEAHRPAADARGIELRLIGVERERHDVVRQRQQHAEDNERRGRAHLAERQPGNRHTQRAGHDQPFALEAVGEEPRERGAQGCGNGDDEGVAEARRDRDALFHQECRHPVREAVEADRLEDVEDDQHQRAREIGRAEYIEKAAVLFVGDRFRRSIARDAGGRLPLRDDLVGIFKTAVAREPARAFGHLQPDPPHHARAQRTDQHDDAPAVHAERLFRHQEPREKRHDGDGGELHDLVEREGAAAEFLRHDLGDVGVDGHELDADAHAGKKPPQIEAQRRRLKRHHGGRRHVPKERQREDRAAPEAVGEEAQERRADEKACEKRRDESRDTVRVEEAFRGEHEDVRVHEARRDIARQEHVVEFEEAAQRQKRDARPGGGVRGQPIETSRDLGSRNDQNAPLAIKSNTAPPYRTWPGSQGGSDVECGTDFRAALPRRGRTDGGPRAPLCGTAHGRSLHLPRPHRPGHHAGRSGARCAPASPYRPFHAHLSLRRRDLPPRQSRQCDRDHAGRRELDDGRARHRPFRAHQRRRAQSRAQYPRPAMLGGAAQIRRGNGAGVLPLRSRARSRRSSRMARNCA